MLCDLEPVVVDVGDWEDQWHWVAENSACVSYTFYYLVRIIFYLKNITLQFQFSCCLF